MYCYSDNICRVKFWNKEQNKGKKQFCLNPKVPNGKTFQTVPALLVEGVLSLVGAVSNNASGYYLRPSINIKMIDGVML